MRQWVEISAVTRKVYKLKLLIADDHDLLRDTLVAFIQNESDIETSSSPDLMGALKLIENEGPFDLVILDYKMPGMNGLDGLRWVCNMPDAFNVALLSGEANRKIAEAALEVGATGFIPKTLSSKSLINAIKFMATGERYLPIEFLTEEPAAKEHPFAQSLTEREMQVLSGLSEGKSNKEIGRDLGLAEPTIKLHVKTLYRKIGVANRTQAALIAREQGLF